MLVAPLLEAFGNSEQRALKAVEASLDSAQRERQVFDRVPEPCALERVQRGPVLLWEAATDDDAARWYAASTIEASMSGSATVSITATTPLPVMCALRNGSSTFHQR